MVGYLFIHKERASEWFRYKQQTPGAQTTALTAGGLGTELRFSYPELTLFLLLCSELDHSNSCLNLLGRWSFSGHLSLS